MSDYKNKELYKHLIVAWVLMALAFQGWRTLFNNFAVENVGVSGVEVGVIQSIREVPGFLAFLVIYLVIFIKEQKLTGLSIVVLGIGVFTTGLLPSYHGLMITTFVMSIGFHYFETVSSSLVLQNFSKKNAPLVFGRLKAIMSMTNIIVGGLIVCSSYVLSIELNFLLIGFITVFGGIYLLLNPPAVKEVIKQEKRFILKKKYWLYYVLNFLSGSRRQLFVVFAVFLLVQKYEFTLLEVAALFIINNVIGYFLNPIIAISINKYGERKVLSLEYVALVFVFYAYTQWDWKWGVALLYILDHIFFNFSFALKTYLQKIAEPEDIAPSNAIGFAINHIAAVVIPFIGGLLWMNNWRLPFYAGVGLSIFSLFFVQFIRVKKEVL